MDFVTDRPDLYDALYCDFTDDLEMYVSYASNFTEILLCGAGTGRTTFPIAQKGIRVNALDISDNMLLKLRENMENLSDDIKQYVNLIKADMCSFDLGFKVSCCIVPFSTFNYLLTIEQQINALNCIHSHLNKGGSLVLELLSAKTFPELFQNSDFILGHVANLENKKNEMWRKTTFDTATQIITQIREYRFFKDEILMKKETVEWVNRFFFTGEIEVLLNCCGYSVNKLYGTYSFDKFDNQSEFVVVEATAR